MEDDDSKTGDTVNVRLGADPGELEALIRGNCYLRGYRDALWFVVYAVLIAMAIKWGARALGAK